MCGASSSTTANLNRVSLANPAWPQVGNRKGVEGGLLRSCGTSTNSPGGCCTLPTLKVLIVGNAVIIIIVVLGVGHAVTVIITILRVRDTVIV